MNRLLLAATILSLGFGQLTRISIGGLPEFYLHDALIAIFLILNLRALYTKKLDKARRYSLNFIVVLALSLFVNRATYGLTLINVLYSVRIAVYLLAFAALRTMKVSKKEITMLLLTAGAIAAAIGLSQYVLLPDTRYLYYLGWDDHLNRLIFPYYDPTFAGSIFGVSLLLATSLSLPSVIRYSLFVILFPAILLTYARSVFLSFAAAVVAGFKKARIWVLVGLLFAVLLLPRRFGEGTNLLRTYSIASRLEHDRMVLQIALKHPMFGVGMNNTATALDQTSDFPLRAVGANNSYLHLFATTGVLGLWVFLPFLYELVGKSKYKAIWTFILVASLFNNVLFYPFILPWLLILESSKHP